MAGRDGEGDVLEGLAPARVVEIDVIKGDRAPGSPQLDRVRAILDVRFCVKEVERSLQSHELLLHGADGRADRLERSIDRCDVRQKDEQLADAELVVQDMKGAHSENQSRAGRGPCVDHQ